MNAAGDVRDNQIRPESAADSPTQAAEIYFHTGFPFDQVKLSSARRATISARATIDQAGSRKGAGEGEPRTGITGSITSIGLDRKRNRLNSSTYCASRLPSSA